MTSGPAGVTRLTHGTTALIELGDGSRLNALGRADWRALDVMVAAASADPDVAAVVIAGSGTTFSAGSDLNEWSGSSLEEVERTFDVMEACFQTIEGAPVPVLAAVEGVAAGAGCQLALACDLVVMSQAARLGMPVARLGILASRAFAARVSRRCGTAMAADLYLTGRLLTADESLRAGLVTRLVPPELARAEAIALAEVISSTPSTALRAAKDALSRVSPTREVGRRETTGPVAAPRVSYGEFRWAVDAFFANRLPS
ncbi:MAG: enoyl-CoA hydratase/isomerase family protein [Nocardioidaceae bacterium]|nr:enoyl-CoA hydratase/isomerase family protein [Nocardioidaceae bacterium]